MLDEFLVHDKVAEFLREDIEFGDVSLQAFEPQKMNGTFVSKQDGVICGLQLIKIVYGILGNVDFKILVKDGQEVKIGEKLAEVSGDSNAILTGERTILNLMQHMSGISTRTKRIIGKLNDSTIKVTDTRKTTPGLRIFEKYAVKIGGGYNHRLSLSDGLMLKDNHIALAGGVKKAIDKAFSIVGPMTRIEVEVETEEQLNEAISSKVDVIMFDNQEASTIKKWIKKTPKHILTEASGGISEENIASFKGCGVDFISIGALTNYVKPLDISFLADGAIKR